MYAVLDIETTGGKFNQEGITEIAIYKFDGHTIVDQFISLVNPEKDIQEYVVKLTGINNTMLKNAPKFHEVAKRIIEITSNCTLVAHNADFDYRILRTEFKRLGYKYKKNTLCTVTLSRKLIPKQSSYKLGKLCKNLGIPITDRHRASGDAYATVQLFKILLEKDVDKNIIQKNVILYESRNIPRKLNKILNSTPEVKGVFYLHDQEGNVIFVGRGKNIKSAVNKVFIKETKRGAKIQEKVASITYEQTGNELLTRVKYYLEINALKPKYNFNRKRKLTSENFVNDHMLLIDKGRFVEENSVILIENNEVVGYGFTNLSFQENQLNVLKSMLTPIEDKLLAKTIIKNYLNKNSVLKIVRLDDELL